MNARDRDHCKVDNIFLCQLANYIVCNVYLDLPGDHDDHAVRALVHLTCNKRSLRLSKGAKRKTWCPSVTDCLNSFVIFAQVHCKSL